MKTLGERFKSAEQLCFPCGLSAIHRVNWANQMKCIEPHARAATGLRLGRSIHATSPATIHELWTLVSCVKFLSAMQSFTALLDS